MLEEAPIDDAHVALLYVDLDRFKLINDTHGHNAGDLALKQVRDILYATDVVQAFMDFYDRGEAGIYNIGGGEPNVISLLDSIDLILTSFHHTSRAHFGREWSDAYWLAGVGNTVAMPPRSTPSIRPNLSVAAAKIPPVLPSETTASASPSRTNPTARAIEQSRFLRRAAAGLSSMVSTSLA